MKRLLGTVSVLALSAVLLAACVTNGTYGSLIKTDPDPRVRAQIAHDPTQGD